MNNSQNKNASLTNKSSSSKNLGKAQKNPILSKTKVIKLFDDKNGGEVKEAVTVSSDIHVLPLQSLYVSPLNVRKSKPSKVDDEHLYSSILIHGIIQNLIVMPKDANNKYAVIAGGRRLAALDQLCENKHITPLRILKRKKKHGHLLKRVRSNTVITS